MTKTTSPKQRTGKLAPKDKPAGATGVLVLADGTVLWGQGLGAMGSAVGEICFNTSITGYQEILTDPSYAGQIITFTFPHIGNVGANAQDTETKTTAARGLILRAPITGPSNWRAAEPLDAWLKKQNLIGLSGLDTRALTIFIRDTGAPTGVVAHSPDGKFDLEALHKKAAEWPGLEGMDLARDVSCRKTYEWSEGQIGLPGSMPAIGGSHKAETFHVVAIDYGAKLNILRCLADAGCRVTVVPAQISAEDVQRLNPDGLFLSNGPGDPAATGVYAVPVIKAIMDKGIPIFGICLGHQLLALALGGKTRKLKLGHRGANQPVKDLQTGRVEITSQNHGFVVVDESLPPNAEITHVSLFDKTNEGLRVKDKPAFSVQYHPEASPGPHDSHYLFHRFVEMMQKHKSERRAA
ncbi:MAG: glutamine-hydrolyzing carbamoyl-phosphate synthase small subunit [Bdellovibrionales bacterium]